MIKVEIQDMSSDITLINEIKEIKRRLNKIEKTLIQILVEKEEVEFIPEREYRELVKKAEHLKNHPENGLSIEEAIKELELAE